MGFTEVFVTVSIYKFPKFTVAQLWGKKTNQLLVEKTTARMGYQEIVLNFKHQTVKSFLCL